MVGEWPFQPLNGIVQCPTLRRDGSLLATEGYDQATGLMLVGNVKMPQISKQPTRDDAESALKLLLSLLDEFPFVDAESKSVALSHDHYTSRPRRHDRGAYAPGEKTSARDRRILSRRHRLDDRYRRAMRRRDHGPGIRRN